MKYRIAFLLVIAMLILTVTPGVFAAKITEVKNDNHIYDTVDYCLRAYDIEIGLTDINTFKDDTDDEALHQLILETASPVVWIRENKILTKKLENDELTVDFSAFKKEASEAGYPVTITAPTRTYGVTSKLTFKVFVVDDIHVTVELKSFDGSESRTVVWSKTDNPITLSDLPTPEQTGYDFMGWYKDEACSEPFLVNGDAEYSSQELIENISLYPKWQKKVVVYVPRLVNIHLDGMPDSIVTDLKWNVDNGVPVTLKDLPTPEMEGYVFNGWYKDEACSEPFLIPGDAEYSRQYLYSSITLYPLWQQIFTEPQKVVIHLVGETGEQSVVWDVESGEPLTADKLPTPEKEGYVFKGWYLDSACTQPFLLLEDGEYSQQYVDQELTIYPCWEKAEELTETEDTPEISEPNGDVNDSQPQELSTGTSGTSQQNSGNAANDKTSKPAEKQNGINKVSLSENKETGGSNNLMGEIVILTALTGSACVLYTSILSDFAVLRWYEQKKRARGR